MNKDKQYQNGKKQLEQKFGNTIKERELKNLREMEVESEINDKFNFFCNKIIRISLSNINLLEEYKKSENLNNLKNSDNIKKAMKEYIINNEYNKPLNMVEENNFKFNDDLEIKINYETQKSLNSFIYNFKNTKKSKVLKSIGNIKTKFEKTFFPQKFHINKYDEEINKKMLDLEFEANDREEINSLVNLIMKQKLNDLIKKEK